MELQEIEVFIDNDGAVRVEVRGVKGTACLDITKGLEAVLGNGIVSRELTQEAQETFPQAIDPRLPASRRT
jgi:hypothetical protein